MGVGVGVCLSTLVAADVSELNTLPGQCIHQAPHHTTLATCHPTNRSPFLTPCLPRAAVHYEKGDYAAAIADCDKAVERGRELRADYALIARALARKGNALVKQVCFCGVSGGVGEVRLLCVQRHMRASGAMRS